MGTSSATGQPTSKAARPRTTSRQSLANALFTTTQQRLFGLLFGQPGRSFFVTELIGLAKVGRGAVQRELSRLEYSKLVVTKRLGNQKHYRANPDAPVYEELCSIVRKTVGVGEQVRAALEPLKTRITVAFIYGSVARQSDRADSDIDLLIVSDDLILEDVYARLANVEDRLGRQVSPAIFTGREFSERRDAGSAFLERVLSGPIILLQGSLDAT